MGPALKFTPSEGEAKKTLKKLLPVYEKLITELGKVTRDTAVIIAPKLKAKSKKEFNLLLPPLFKEAGFKFDEPLIYAPTNARMIREIWILKKIWPRRNLYKPPKIHRNTWEESKPHK